jgi:hypothetical protein
MTTFVTLFNGFVAKRGDTNYHRLFRWFCYKKGDDNNIVTFFYCGYVMEKVMAAISFFFFSPFFGPFGIIH